MLGHSTGGEYFSGSAAWYQSNLDNSFSNRNTVEWSQAPEVISECVVDKELSITAQSFCFSAGACDDQACTKFVSLHVGTRLHMPWAGKETSPLFQGLSPQAHPTVVSELVTYNLFFLSNSHQGVIVGNPLSLPLHTTHYSFLVTFHQEVIILSS